MKAAAIIGGGPAGCQCALWLKMLGHEPIIIEQSDKLGGLQAMNPYQNNWIVGMMDITGRELAHHIQKHIELMDIPVLFNANVTQMKRLAHGFELSSEKKVIQSRYIVIATGVKPRSEYFSESQDVIIGPGQRVFDYDFTNKRVAILGGGDNAAENYAFIMKKKPKYCHIYSRTVRARSSLWADVNQDDVYLYPYDVDQASMTITHQNTKNEYDVIIILYGWEANFPAAFTSLKSDLLDDRGFIATDMKCRTPVPGIYAIGEVANRMHPCVTTSMADGVVAAKAIEEALSVECTEPRPSGSA